MDRFSLQSRCRQEEIAFYLCNNFSVSTFVTFNLLFCHLLETYSIRKSYQPWQKRMLQTNQHPYINWSYHKVLDISYNTYLFSIILKNRLLRFKEIKYMETHRIGYVKSVVWAAIDKYHKIRLFKCFGLKQAENFVYLASKIWTWLLLKSKCYAKCTVNMICAFLSKFVVTRSADTVEELTWSWLLRSRIYETSSKRKLSELKVLPHATGFTDHMGQPTIKLRDNERLPKMSSIILFFFKQQISEL